MKKSLNEALREILQSETVSTQDEIKSALEQQGFSVNQSKISRLLHKIGASKTMNERRQIAYSLPHDPAPPTAKNVLSQLVINITANEQLIVIHANPGSASLIARLIDHNREELYILGTVAGDDTVFIAPKSVKKINLCLEAIKALIANQGDFA